MLIVLEMLCVRRIMDLSGNGLSGTLPTTLSALSGLQSFTLSSNAFVSSVPDIWGHMNSLVYVMCFMFRTGLVRAGLSVGTRTCLQVVGLVWQRVQRDVAVVVVRSLRADFLERSE